MKGDTGLTNAISPEDRNVRPHILHFLQFTTDLFEILYYIA